MVHRAAVVLAEATIPAVRAAGAQITTATAAVPPLGQALLLRTIRVPDRPAHHHLLRAFLRVRAVDPVQEAVVDRVAAVAEAVVADQAAEVDNLHNVLLIHIYSGT